MAKSKDKEADGRAMTPELGPQKSSKHKVKKKTSSSKKAPKKSARRIAKLQSALADLSRACEETAVLLNAFQPNVEAAGPANQANHPVPTFPATKLPKAAMKPKKTAELSDDDANLPACHTNRRRCCICREMCKGEKGERLHMEEKHPGEPYVLKVCKRCGLAFDGPARKRNWHSHDRHCMR